MAMIQMAMFKDPREPNPVRGRMPQSYPSVKPGRYEFSACRKDDRNVLAVPLSRAELAAP